MFGYVYGSVPAGCWQELQREIARRVGIFCPFWQEVEIHGVWLLSMQTQTKHVSYKILSTSHRDFDV
jgi:hypothetical protein